MSYPSHSDAFLVGKLNEVFYDVEAERYDERHPEVVEGDAEWWRSRGQALIDELKSRLTAGRGLMILDLGCGTGFVASVLCGSLGAGDRMIGVDQSEAMLERARRKLSAIGGNPCLLVRGDAACLHFRSASFEMVAVSSLLHHVYDYRAVLEEIDRVLKPGGYLVLAHEPNKEFFRSSWRRMAASAWKLIGFGMTLPRELSDEINRRLRGSNLFAADLAPDEILRFVEYHSPLEQGRIRVDENRGFSPRTLLDEHLRGYSVVELNEYSTFHHRPLLERHRWLMRAATAAGRLLEGSGNLFSAVLRKEAL